MTQVRCLTLFTSHHESLLDLAESSPMDVDLAHVAVLPRTDSPLRPTAMLPPGPPHPVPSLQATDAAAATPLGDSCPDSDNVNLAYRVLPGPGPGSLGLRAAAAAGIPACIVQVAAHHAKRLRARVAEEEATRRDLRLACELIRAGARVC